MLVALLVAAWFFRDALRPKAEELWGRVTGKAAASAADENGKCGQDGQESQDRSTPEDALSSLAAKYGLSITNDAGRTILSGNFRTRAERLAATGAVYSEQLGAELDLTDDESLHTAAADSLFTLTEGALKVSAATNRVLAITGVSPSASALAKTLRALSADMPKLRNVDVTAVTLDGTIASAQADSEPKTVGTASGSMAGSASRATKKVQAQQSLPVCGILTVPYPCLVMQNGQRILEGATIGDSVILKIAADSVTVTNANGRFTWKP